MYFQFGWRMGVVIVVCLGVFIPVAQAQTPFDVTECGSGPVTMVYQSNEITISGLEGKGIFFSNHANKVLDNCTFQVVQIARIIGGNRRSDSYWKIMDPDGDVIIAELVVLGPEKTMKFIHGTGKWKGIKGEATEIPTVGAFFVPQVDVD